MKRDPVGKLAVLTLIVVLAGVAWLSRNLGSPAVATAEDWPLVGPLVRTLRERYVPVRSTQPMAGDAESPAEQTPPVVRVDSTERKSVWVRAGTTLLEAPREGATVVDEVEGISRLAVLESLGEWYRVVHDQRVAWVRLPGYDDGTPPLGSEPEPPRPLPGREADPELMARALEILNGGERIASLSGYRLVTDSQDGELLRFLGEVVAGVEAVYEARYGIEPIDMPHETIVLFDRERDYRRLQNGLERLEGLPASGLVSRGMVAAFAGGRGRQEIGATVIHELTHLLNRRALGPALPPWLDEGLAGDLASSEIGDDGLIRARRLGGSFRAVGGTRIWWGGRAALGGLQRDLAAGASFDLQDLTALEWRKFVSQKEGQSYPLSALLVRFLVQSEDLRDGFQGFLRAVANGGSVEPSALLERLDLTWQELNDGLAAWVRAGGSDGVDGTAIR